MMLSMSAGELRDRRKHLRSEYGFTEAEQRFIGRQKPNFFLYDKTGPDVGIEAVSGILKEKFGFNKELVRTLVLKNPQILGKSRGQINFIFEWLKDKKQIDETTTMQKIFEVPALMNVDIPVKAKEVDEMFEIYHGISPEEVKSIFLDFPYLYCCPSRKLQVFLGEFRKYRFTKDQILNLVSENYF